MPTEKEQLQFILQNYDQIERLICKDLADSILIDRETEEGMAFYAQVRSRIVEIVGYSDLPIDEERLSSDSSLVEWCARSIISYSNYLKNKKC